MVTSLLPVKKKDSTVFFLNKIGVNFGNYFYSIVNLPQKPLTPKLVFVVFVLLREISEAKWRWFLLTVTFEELKELVF